MTMISTTSFSVMRALMWKELTQQRVLYGLLLAATWVGLTVVAATQYAKFLDSLWLLSLGLVTMVLAVSSLSNEYVDKTDRFLRYLPLKESSLFWMKFLVTGVLCSSFLLLEWIMPTEAVSAMFGTTPAGIGNVEQSMGVIVGVLILSSLISYCRLSPLLTVVVTGIAFVLLIMWEIYVFKLFHETAFKSDVSQFSFWRFFMTYHGLLGYGIILGFLLLISTTFLSATGRWRSLIPIGFVAAYLFTSISPNIVSHTYKRIVGMPNDRTTCPTNLKIWAPTSGDGHLLVSCEEGHSQPKSYQWVRSIDLNSGDWTTHDRYYWIYNDYSRGRVHGGSKYTFSSYYKERSFQRLITPYSFEPIRWNPQAGKFEPLPKTINRVLGWYDKDTVIARYDGYRKTGLVNVTTGEKRELVLPERSRYSGSRLVVPGLGLIISKNDIDSGELTFAVCTPDAASPHVVRVKGNWESPHALEVTSDGQYVLLATRNSANPELKNYHIIDLGQGQDTSLVLPPFGKRSKVCRQVARLLQNSKQILVNTSDGYALYDIEGKSWKTKKLSPHLNGKITISQVSPDERWVIILNSTGKRLDVLLADLATDAINELNLQFQCAGLPSDKYKNSMAWIGDDHLLMQGRDGLWMVSIDGTEQKELLP